MTSTGRGGAAVVVLALMSAAAPARADVLEVGADGAVLVRRGTGAAVWSAAEPAGGGDAGSVESAPDVPASALTVLDPPEAPAAFRAELLGAAGRHGVSPALLAALVRQESGWRPAALSPKGAVGLGQLMPATARALAVDPRVPGSNLDGAARYLRRLLDLFDGNVERALAAYNAGPGRVLRAGGIPAIAETRTYVSRIIDRLAAVGPVALASTGAGR